MSTSEQLLADLDEFQQEIAGRVPAMVVSRVARVSSIVRETVPRLDQLGAGSYQAHTVVATATSYLPEAVGGYLRLPRSWADTRPIANGKTALLLLCDQLDLLAYKMDQIFDAVCRADAAALIAHGQFLAEKFGDGGGLDLGGPISVPPQPSVQPSVQPLSPVPHPEIEDDEPTGPGRTPPPRRLEPPTGTS
ncbi:hypothetical protein KIH74_03310 [Kineosporia sp. J2-2]|uniref:Uncharacterized protein n=1 Tax=Kineosporia corallincola TaxID=2835133 RepID=A0ABS5TA47_9ACTN|nr:hypothetical protein [Kineosporia corallincola]MBT0767935.1 hypothetical protein [Kineosporia corallincola]